MSKGPALEDCVHCGLCLPACPTYEQTGLETQSPRGRIAALRLLDSEHASTISPAIQKGLDECLVCRACESHCPAGVNMEELIIDSRKSSRPRLKSWWVQLILLKLLAKPKRLRLVRPLLIVGLPIGSAFNRILNKIAPRFSIELFSAKRLRKKPFATIKQNTNKKVLLWTGCAASLLLQEEQHALASVLGVHGFAVEYAAPQCCGALHGHSTQHDCSEKLVEQFLDLLQNSDADYVVSESAGCTAWMKKCQAAQPSDQPCAKVIDVYELLLEVGLKKPNSRLKGHWIHFVACHQQHGELNRNAIEQIAAQLFESRPQKISPYEHCCGAAGIYSLEHKTSSRNIGQKSLADLKAVEKLLPSDEKLTGLVSANAGCLLRWEHLVQGSLQVKHLLCVLEELYAQSPPR